MHIFFLRTFILYDSAYDITDLYEGIIGGKRFVFVFLFFFSHDWILMTSIYFPEHICRKNWEWMGHLKNTAGDSGMGYLVEGKNVL
jgi:hypothetical protein